MKRRCIALLLSFLMIFTMVPTTAFATDFLDMPSDWSTIALENAVSNGLLTGFEGKLMPMENLTRAEMATIVNRAFGAYEKSTLEDYKDVLPDSWFYDEMAKAVQMGTFLGNNDKLNPNSNITREEAFTVLARAFKLSNTNENVINNFSDGNLISDWAIEGVSSLVSSGYVAGSNEKLNPKKNITRAEFAQIMYNLIKTYIVESGVYTDNYYGNVMINVADVTLKDLTIKGDLIIGDGVGDGDITLDGVTVTGRTIIRGGGENSIKLIGKSNINNIIVARVNGQVRLLAEDGTEVGEVIIDGNDNVIVEGNIKSIIVKASDIMVSFNKANVNSIIVTGEKSNINVSKDSSINAIVVNGNETSISGNGKVGKIEINAENVNNTIKDNISAGGGGSSSKTPSPIKSYGNEFEIGTYEEFRTGEEFNNVTLVSNIGDGAITLKKQNGKYPKQGEYISQVIDVPNFEYMIASWNSDAPEGTHIEIQARVLVNHFDENNSPIQTWTDWLSWGKWSPFIERASDSRIDALAKTSVDELVISGIKGETASKVQLKAILYTEDTSITPTVRYLHGTLKNTLSGQTIEKEFKGQVDITNLDKVIPTPYISQMVRDPRIASSICSPTTITMMMNRMGEDLIPEEVAQNNYDFNYGFGNWSFTMASTGSYGYKAYVDYTTIEGLKREIAKGYPVGVSVKYTNDPGNTKYPYLEGSPGTTGGHLFLVTGFKTIDGIEYVIANDPFAPSNETVERQYKLDQFVKAWTNNVAYIVHDKEDNAGDAHTKRVNANLRVEKQDEYEVYYNGENIDIRNFGGNIAYTIDNGKTFNYFPKHAKNTLTFNNEVISNPNLKVYIITDIGYVYVATLKVTKPIESYGNEFEIGTYEEFETGVEFNNVTLVDDIGDGAITLRSIEGSYPQQGEYISQVIDVPNFEYMVASWNSDAPEGTHIEIQARVLVNHFDGSNNPTQTWTDWLSWGKWSPFIERASATRRDTLARTSVDELIINGSKGETASKVQLKAILYTEDPSITPTVRYLHGTLKNTLSGQAIEKEFKDDVDITNLDKIIPTPYISQMVRDPRIASLICSPTTITMMMNRMGEDLIPEEVAQNNYDFKYKAFGNWSFTMASTGSYGYKAYVDYTTIEGLKREIAKGYPVGVSVKYTNDPSDTRYPYLEGSPGATGGHLFLVTGFTTIDGVEYVVANDPYAESNETVKRQYKLDQFVKAWTNNVAYIVHDKEENAGYAHTKRVEAELRKTEIPNEYEVYYNDSNINVQNFGGNIAYTIDNGETYKYFPKHSKNTLTFDDEVITNPNLVIYIITDIGYVYVATAEGIVLEEIIEVVEPIVEEVEQEIIDPIEEDAVGPEDAVEPVEPEDAVEPEEPKQEGEPELGDSNLDQDPIDETIETPSASQ